MIALLQRASHGSVVVNGETIGQIDQGLVVLIGIQKSDDEFKAQKLVDKLLNYRVFSDYEGKMNLSIKDTEGGLLLIPQFTLAASTKKGSRPSFSSAAAPAFAEKYFNHFVELAKNAHSTVATGQFGADMKVSLTNDGPVTFWLEV